MYKTILKRMQPVVSGSFIGVAVFAAILYVMGWSSGVFALYCAAFVFVVYSCVQFFLIRKEVLDEMLETHRVNTPLPIVYVGEKNKNDFLYEEPYLDLNLMDKIWGFAVGNLFVSLRNYKEGNGEKFRFEDIKMSLRKEFLSGKQIARLPTSDELYLIRKEFKKVKATIMLLNFYDVPAEDFKDDRYLCLDDVTDYNSDEHEKPMEQAFSMNMSESKNPNKMEFPDTAYAFVRLVAKL